jgi:TP901 family phage tail tape measure protein
MVGLNDLMSWRLPPGVGRASDIATDIMTAFGLEVSDLGGIIDVITATFTSFNTDVNLLASGLFKVGPVAGQLGIALEEVSAALGVLSGAGIKGEEAGTALRNIFIRLINPSSEAARLLAEMGITARDAEGNFLTLTEIVQQFERAMSTMGPEAETALAEIIGTRGFAAMLRLIDSLDEGEKSLGEFTAGLQNVEGAAEEMTDFINDSTAFTLREFEAQLNELKLQLGEAMIPVLEDLITVFEENRDEIVQAIVTLADLVPAILFVVQGITNLINVWRVLNEELGEFRIILPVIIALLIAFVNPLIGVVLLAAIFGDELEIIARALGIVVRGIINFVTHLAVLIINIAGLIRLGLIWIGIWDDLGRAADFLNEKLQDTAALVERISESRLAQGIGALFTTTGDIGASIEQNFQRGTRSVPRTGFALVHAGEEIINPRLGQQPSGESQGGVVIQRVEINVDASDRDFAGLARQMQKEFKKSMDLLSLR